MTWTLPQFLPLAMAVEEYMISWDGILCTATRLFPASIQITTSGMQFWGCA